jgi:hypothetical protein
MDKTGKIIRIAAIVLFGMAVAMTLLGGVGTSCVAFSNNKGFRMAFLELQDYRWLYQIFVVTTVLIGLVGIWGLIKLVRGGKNAYWITLLILLVASIITGIHFVASYILREGEAAPTNVVFFINLLALIVFLLFLVPGIREKVDFSSPGGKNDTQAAGGVAAIMAGTLILTVFHWAGPSHSFTGQNWTYAFYLPLVTAGTALILWGIVLIGKAVREIIAPQVKVARLKIA